ncbi:MAG: hypothetical protein B6240_09480 [Desulfobacteraceae bacterium 4572_87]|nr:MAG: hypothetical protein B6240_09480 [Desulfobacteraceae bacterium 4572_87]
MNNEKQNETKEVVTKALRPYGTSIIPTIMNSWPTTPGKELVRFCFCKKDETLDEAIKRLTAFLG